ncbi:helix-turn-helix domain-containing protein [Acaryochloris marina]|uniref:HTH cro/C1-type domain-containing protein n=1 Tax=Acaryochloris marina (strain MBIC 11017) TaxID=329726 RepID=A8ZQF0_ACAM1|nr:helix-turn-helix transcriptional regulator [Acaryochloris marina]ABW33236.1 conserved hypothetical protein [Acaryochloris marina MBIC11017]
MVKQLITWKLKEHMAANKISVPQLAARLGISENAVINMRRSEMPRINGERLNQIIVALNAMRKKGKKRIQVQDLIVLTFSMDEADEARIHE